MRLGRQSLQGYMFLGYCSGGHRAAVGPPQRRQPGAPEAGQQLQPRRSVRARAVGGGGRRPGCLRCGLAGTAQAACAAGHLLPAHQHAAPRPGELLCLVVTCVMDGMRSGFGSCGVCVIWVTKGGGVSLGIVTAVAMGMRCSAVQRSATQRSAAKCGVQHSKSLVATDLIQNPCFEWSGMLLLLLHCNDSRANVQQPACMIADLQPSAQCETACLTVQNVIR